MWQGDVTLSGVSEAECFGKKVRSKNFFNLIGACRNFLHIFPRLIFCYVKNSEAGGMNVQAVTKLTCDAKQ